MRSPLITVMSNAAVKAGKVLLRDYGEVDQLQISRKGTANFVTKTDLKVEKLLVMELKRARPEFGFLLEEGGEKPGQDAGTRWIVDPLDGTSNFIHAVPYFCISIALEKTLRPGVNEIVAGVIYDPMHNELFYAEKGHGAMLNDRRLSCAARTQFEAAMIATGNPCDGSAKERALARLKEIAAHPCSLRTMGASALDLAYVAAGRYDACWLERIQPWDVAAGILLVREAGGMVTGQDGTPATPYGGSLIAASQSMHDKLAKLLAVPRSGN